MSGCTNSSEKLNSLVILTRLSAATPQWLLVDVYIDIVTGKTGSSLRELNRMLEDYHSNKLDIILTKSISGFWRDTVEILDALNQIKLLGVRVIFEQENWILQVQTVI